jgi:hypothetical protein
MATTGQAQTSWIQTQHYFLMRHSSLILLRLLICGLQGRVHDCHEETLP